MCLQNKALLVKLSLSLPGNSRKDASITASTIAAHHMGEKSGRWLKQIFPDEAIEPLVKITGEIRTWHYQHTLPWSDEGYRILPTAMHQEYTDKMREFRAQYQAAQAQFIGRMSDWESWARIAHNGTFDSTLYDVEKVNRKFGMKLDFNPIPASSDFRCDVDQADKEALDTRVQEAETQAQADLWHRLADPLKAMVERLSLPDRANGMPPIFRDSLISNLQDIVSLIPKLDLAQDMALAAFAQEASKLSENTPDTLRADKVTRNETAKKAQAILDRMAGYMPVAAE